jgi:hypothetical protein
MLFRKALPAMRSVDNVVRALMQSLGQGMGGKVLAFIMLNLRRPWTWKPMAIDKALPDHEFVDRQLIAFSAIIEAQTPAPQTYGGADGTFRS